MKPSLLFATLSMVFASPTLLAKSELEILRAKCAEQERQIQQLEDDNSKLRTGNPVSRPTPAAVQAKADPQPRPEDVSKPGVTAGSSTYVVKAGDSLEKIARKVSTTPEVLAKSNGLKTKAVIHPGQKLKVPNAASIASLNEPTAPAKPTASPAAAVTPGRKYTIRDNDTFSSISRKQKISVAALIAANPKVKPTALRTGQVINLSKPSPAPETVAKSPAIESPKPTVATKSPTPPQATTPVMASKPAAPAVEQTPAVSAPAPFSKSTPIATPPGVVKSEPTAATTPLEVSSPTPEKKIHPITIEGEMTYEEFAAKHGTNPERLNALNGLDLSNATVLAKGSELYVPAQP